MQDFSNREFVKILDPETGEVRLCNPGEPIDHTRIVLDDRRPAIVSTRQDARAQIYEMMKQELFADLTFWERIKAWVSLKFDHPIRGNLLDRALENFSRWYAWNVSDPFADNAISRLILKLRHRVFGVKVIHQRGIRNDLARQLLEDCKKAGVDPKGDIQTTYFSPNATKF